MEEFSLIQCVVNIGDASKALRSAKKHGAKGGTIMLATGTVQSRFLGFLGLNEVRKEIVSIIVEIELTSEILKGISEDMQFHKPNHGIAFALGVNQFIGSKSIIGSKSVNNEVKHSMYKIIHVIVDKGKGEDVIDAANKAGARGGTIINARGSGIHEVQKLFSIEIEPEKEDVFIIAREEIKDAIVESVRTQLSIDEPGKGILFVLDISEVYGLHEGS